MSLEHWRLGQLHKGNIEAARMAESLIAKFGDIPVDYDTSAVDSSKSLDYLAIQQAVSPQIDRLVGFGFHRSLRTSEVKFRQSFTLPEDITQPEPYKGKFDIPIVVDPRMSFSTYLKRLKIDFDHDPIRFRILDKPYLMWVSLSARSRFQVTNEGVAFEDTHEVGVSTRELMALYAQHPEKFRETCMMATGNLSPVFKPYTNYISEHNGSAFLSNMWMYAWPTKSFVTRGRLTTELG